MLWNDYCNLKTCLKIEPSLHPKDKSHLTMENDPLMCFWVQFAYISLRVLVSVSNIYKANIILIWKPEKDATSKDNYRPYPWWNRYQNSQWERKDTEIIKIPGFSSSQTRTCISGLCVSHLVVSKSLWPRGL